MDGCFVVVRENELAKWKCIQMRKNIYIFHLEGRKWPTCSGLRMERIDCGGFIFKWNELHLCGELTFKQILVGVGTLRFKHQHNKGLHRMKWKRLRVSVQSFGAQISFDFHWDDVSRFIPIRHNFFVWSPVVLLHDHWQADFVFSPSLNLFVFLSLEDVEACLVWRSLRVCVRPGSSRTTCMASL